MRKPLLYLALVLTSFYCNAQTGKPDTLERLLLTQRSDTNRVSLLLKGAWAVHYTDPALAMSRAQKR